MPPDIRKSIFPGLNTRCGSLGIMGVLTPYGTGPSPIYHDSGYVGRSAFRALGAVFGVIYFVPTWCWACPE